MEIHIAVWYVGAKISEEHAKSNFRVIEESNLYSSGRKKTLVGIL
jgi:hypothetical protein